MDSDKWHEVKEIFHAALQRPPEEREQFLNESCKDDAHLRSEVESLLSSSEAAGSFMQHPAVDEIAGAIARSKERLQVGQSLSRYRILALLGEGGMGQVYLAEDARLERKVALKILPAAFAQDAGRMRRFVQEAKTASALNHPNILTIYETGEVEHKNYIASEFVEGETLSERLRRDPLNLTGAMDVAVQITSALQAAHAAGIVHRDIKPDNVMIRADGVAKLLDFGIAKLTEKKTGLIDAEAATAIKAGTSPGMIIGTAAYMSPEQALGKAVDARSDIFSFGLVLYEMVTGKRAFAGENAMDVISSILQKEPVSLRLLIPEVPPELERIVGKALRKDCEERYQTAKDLLIDLKDVRQELDFQKKIARTAAPPQEPAETEIINAAATDPVQTVSGTQSLAAKIKSHKRGTAIGLMVLLLASIGLGYWYFSNHISNPKQIESIAVMPFVNQSGNAETEYLSDGISEALINSLTELQQLRVIARSTAFRYKGREVDPQAVGRELNVGAVLMGRVRQMGDRLNVQVDLVDATTGAQLWGQEYERKVSELLSVKQTIAREVTEKLRLRLSGEQQQQLDRRDTTNAEAYQFYLRGRYFWNKRTADGIRKAIEEFQQAIGRDPNYALGYVGLADSYLVLGLSAGVPESENLPKARAAADRALQLDNSLAEAHASSAFIYQNQWRWAEAEEEYKRAISLNPNYPTAHQWFSIYFRAKRQFDDSMREIKRAQELDPLSPIISNNVADVYLLKNDLNSAIAECQRLIELDPSFPQAYQDLGFAYLKQRRYEEAIAEFRKAVEVSGRGSGYLADLGYCYAVTGRRTEALAILKELEEKYARRESIGQYLARVYAGLGDKDQAFAWLEKDFEQRNGRLWLTTFWFSFDDLRSDPRYADLVRRMGLTP